MNGYGEDQIGETVRLHDLYRMVVELVNRDSF